MLVIVVMEGEGSTEGVGGVVDKKKFRRGAILSMLFVVAGCASLTEYERLHVRASKNFFYGNYDACIQELANSLRIDSGNEEARSLLARAYRRAVKVHEGRIRQIKKRNDRLMWDLVVSEYRRMVELNEVITALSIPDFEIQDFSRLLDEANNKAAEARYRESLSLMKPESLWAIRCGNSAGSRFQFTGVSAALGNL